jgi:3'-phosphoadenosine 5'-phosphosulfate sulfotransferase (PAPS reductase)/FAD synthetase
MREPGRILVWFSCGAASAVAAKLATVKYPSCELVYCDTLVNEHPDNQRFLENVERWTGKKITIIRSDKYKSVDEVIQIRKYMSGIEGAPCTRELKKIPRFKFQLPNDLHIFGLTFEESERILKFERDNSDIDIEWLLFARAITHDDCLEMISDAGIELPAMYKLGFKNNNCIGCVKAGGMQYWARIRKFFPDVFRKRCEQSRALGARLLMIGKTRYFLDELPTGIVLTEDDSDPIDCGVLCVNQARG